MALKHEGSTGVAAAGGVWLQLGGCGCSWGAWLCLPCVLVSHVAPEDVY